MSVKSYDEKSEDLARAFIIPDRRDLEPLVPELALAIQQAIEDWFADHPEEDPEPDERVSPGNRAHARWLRSS
jgi:hypothetical protein